MKIRSAVLAVAAATAGLVVVPAGSAAAACERDWEALGYCNRCHFESSTYNTADDLAFDLLPDIAWRCTS